MQQVQTVSVGQKVAGMPVPLRVSVLRDGDWWVAECGDLGLATEAQSYEQLTERVWEIAPELYELNGLGDARAGLCLEFVHCERYDLRARAV